MFAERLKSARIAKGLSQKDVADYLKITPNAYRKYEYGEREPNIHTLKLLAEYFNVGLDYLVDIDLSTDGVAEAMRELKDSLNIAKESQVKIIEKFIKDFNEMPKDILNSSDMKTALKQLEETLNSRR